MFEKKNKNFPLYKADIVVAAVGRRHIVKGEDLKDGAIVIDIGISPGTTDDKHTTVGDVEFEKVRR